MRWDPCDEIVVLSGDSFNFCDGFVYVSHKYQKINGRLNDIPGYMKDGSWEPADVSREPEDEFWKRMARLKIPVWCSGGGERASLFLPHR